MKTSHYIAIITAALIATSAADTIVLKSGKKYEGHVISQDDKSYLCEIYVTKSIRDERRIPKDQIQEIIREAEDSKQFKNIQSLIPTPDRLTREAYNKRIQATKKFLTKFPRSKHNKEAKTILETLEKEQKVISKGGIKLGGQLISADDMDANAYDIHARILLHDIRHLSSNGHYQMALRKWEILHNEYSKSSAYPKSLKLVSRILKLYKAELTPLMNSLDAREAKRKSVIDSLKPGDRERAITLLAEKQKAYEALIEKEKTEMRTKWLTIDPYHKQALDHNIRSIDTLAKSLENHRKTKDGLAGPIFRGAWSALAKNDLEEARKLIQKLNSMQLPDRYVTPLAEELEQRQVTKAAEEKAAKERAEQERRKKKAEEKAAAEKAAEDAKSKNKGKRSRK